MKFKRVIMIILALFIIGSTAAYANTETDYTDNGTNETDSETVPIATEVTETETKDAAGEEAGTETKDAAGEETGTETKDAAGEETGTETKDAAEEDAGTETKDAAEEDAGTETKDAAEEETGTETKTENTEENNPEKKDADTVMTGADSGLSTGSAVSGLKGDEFSNVVVTELASGKNDSCSGESAASEPESIPTTGTSARIDKFEFKLVENQDYKDSNGEDSKEVNCSILFDFTDTSSGTQYECFITALQIQEKDGKSARERANEVIGKIATDSVTREVLTTKMTEIANSFLSGTGIVLKADNKIVDDLIDAEKYDDSYAVEKLTDFQDAPYGDLELCWAASASNLITYTGWSVNSSTNQTKNEDATFAQFINAFYDNPSKSVLYGFKWYLDGVNLLEDNTNENGDIVLQTKSAYQKELAKVRSTPTESVTISNTLYSADLLTTMCSANVSDGIDDLADNLVDSMKEGNGVALSYAHEIDGILQGSHAVTVFGYIKELLKTGADAMKAMFISDSDNDCPKPQNALPPQNKASETEQTREGRNNTYTMYYTEPMTSALGENTVRMYTSDAAKAQQDSYVEEGKTHSYKGYVNSIEILKSTKTVENEKIPSETEGTGDLKSSPDLSPQSILLSSDEVTTGDSIPVEVMFANMSYKAARAEDGSNLVIKYSLMVYDESDNFLYSIQNQATTAMIKAMGVTTSQFSLPMGTAGTYDLGLQVDAIGYYDAGGIWHEITEAYTTNNVWTNAKVRITVKEPHISETIPHEIPTFCANYLLISEDPLTVSFKMDSKLGKIGTLLNPKGNTVAEDFYSITDNGDGTYVITFSAEFLRSLSVGQHKLTLQTESGKIYFIISIL